MPVRIRLSRVGTNRKPLFRVVAATRERAADGHCLEVLGTYDPKLETEKLHVDKERVHFWLKQGATPSDLISQLLKKQGLGIN